MFPVVYPYICSNKQETMTILFTILITAFVILAPVCFVVIASDELSLKDSILLILSMPFILLVAWLVIVGYLIYWPVKKCRQRNTGNHAAA